MKIKYLATFIALVSLVGVQNAHAATINVSITTGFSPSTVNIVEGDTVLWKNDDSQTRNVSSNVHPAHTEYAPLNLGNVAPGATLSLTFPTAGTYGYHDHLFSSNLGTVVVTAPTPPPSVGVGVSTLDYGFPDPIVDLIISSTTKVSASLAWTATGDDGVIGVAGSYDIRYSTSTITEANWSSATQVKGESSPEVAWSKESMTILGLAPGTTYYFAIKISDEVPNESGISNVARATTLILQESIAPEVISSVTSTTTEEPKMEKPLDVKPTLFAPSVPVILFERTLSFGERSDEVKRLQELLAQNSDIYPEGLVTGYFGYLTVAAVRRFQAKYGIAQVGVLGPQTRKKLGEIFGDAGAEEKVSVGEEVRAFAQIFSRSLTIGARGNDVLILQTVLSQHPELYPEGLVTGYFGPLTEAAVKRFQAKQGIVSSGDPTTTGYGFVGPKTRRGLNKFIIK